MLLENRQAFFSLVRLGIFHEATPINVKDWNSLKALADEQGLSAIVVDGINLLPEGMRPPKELTLQWIGTVLQNFEYRYADYERAIGELAMSYQSHGIKMMVLKGYGLSLNYPVPHHRPCGDIDTWNFGKQQEADEVLKKDYGISIDTSEHHHTVFFWKNFMVENHYDMLITTATKANMELEPLLKELAMDDSHTIDIKGVNVYIPSENFNALFLLRHMLMHFVACGINLRNILDWAFFWEKHGKNVDVEWYREVLEQYNMSAFFGIVNAICVEDLGFNPNIFPSVQFNSLLKERVLQDTLFPKYNWIDAHRLSFFPRLLFKYNRWKDASWKRELCYNESDWSSFCRSVRYHLLKPSSI